VPLPLITAILILPEKSASSRTTVWMPFSTASAGKIYALARGTARGRARCGLRISGEAARRKDSFHCARWTAPVSGISDFGIILGSYMVRNWFLAGRKRMMPYSIQWLMRLKPSWFREDLLTLFDLLRQKKIKPLIAQRLPLCEARHAHELLGSGGVIGKIVLLPNG
jgi:Zinc-binding dehydrogenase